MVNLILYQLVPMVFNMSVTASAVILVVLLARVLLRKAPKAFSYVLWAVVLFRLLCPVSLSADASLLGLLNAPVKEMSPQASAVQYVAPSTAPGKAPGVQPPGVSEAVNHALPQGEEQPAAGPLKPQAAIAACVYMEGVLAMAGYSVVSLGRLRRRLAGAVPLGENIYLADHIGSPFVMGILRPRIYLPSSLTAREQTYILLHERHHIRRLDHVVKALAFMALCIHWFNPLVWLAFALSSKDMEMSCDEAVVKQLGAGIRADYSASLLSLATGRRIIAGTPLAFGEGDTKARIRNLLRWKRPGVWTVLAAAAACAAIIAACAFNPKAGEDPVPEPAGQYASMEEYALERITAILEGNSITYYVTDDNGSFSDEAVTDTVDDARVKVLDCWGTLEGLAPDGTLEVWEFSCEVKPTNAPGREILTAGGGYVTEDGYWCEGLTDLLVVLRRSDNGQYEILQKETSPEHTDFFGYHNTIEEAIYDWYVTENSLDLPLYVEDWIDRIIVPEGGSLGNFPVHRYDGDGWYLYIPISPWEQVAPSADTYRYHWEWTSGYGTGSTLVVNWFTQSVEDEYTVARKQGFTPADSTNQVWVRDQNGVHEAYYIYPGTDGGSLRVWTSWTDANITDYPYIAMEPEVLRLMAESFVVSAGN